MSRAQDGVSMGQAVKNPARQRRDRRRRKREEQAWAAKSGPVKVYRRDG